MQSNIYNLRIQKGFSGVRKLAKACGLSHSEISRLENNRVQNPSIVTCHKIARALNVTIDQLFTFDEEKDSMIIELLNTKPKETPLTTKEILITYPKASHKNKIAISKILRRESSKMKSVKIREQL